MSANRRLDNNPDRIRNGEIFWMKKNCYHFNAFTVLQTSLTINEKKNVFTILCITLLNYKTEELLIMTYTVSYLTNLQYTVITYYQGNGLVILPVA